MKNKIYIFILFLFSFFISIRVYAEEFELYSKNALLYNLNDDTILYEYNSDVKTNIASLTKIVTAMVTIENVEDLSKKVTIKNEDLDGLAIKNASLAGFKVDEPVTYEDLLYGLLLPSGADAAMALARNVSKSEDKFVELMNRYVTKLNLKNTHFENPIGFDDDENYSTLKDFAIIFKDALKNKTFKKIITTMEYENNDIKFTSTIKRTIDKSNIELDYLKGGKTGTTDEAGLCLASIATYNGTDYMLITTNAPYKYPYNYHVMDAKKIYDYYINNYSYQSIIIKNEKLVEIKTKYASPKLITFKSNKTIKKYLKNDFKKDDIKLEYEGINELTPLNKKGDTLGKVNIVYKDEIIDTIEIKLNQFIVVDLKDYYEDNKFKCIIITISIATIIHWIIKSKRKIKKKKKRRVK